MMMMMMVCLLLFGTCLLSSPGLPGLSCAGSSLMVLHLKIIINHFIPAKRAVMMTLFVSRRLTD